MDKLITKNIKFEATAKAYKDLDKKERFFSVQIRDIRNNNIFYIPIKKVWSDTHHLKCMVMHDSEQKLLKEYHFSDVEAVFVSKYGRWYPTIKCIVKDDCSKKEVESWGNK